MCKVLTINTGECETQHRIRRSSCSRRQLLRKCIDANSICEKVVNHTTQLLLVQPGQDRAKDVFERRDSFRLDIWRIVSHYRRKVTGRIMGVYLGIVATKLRPQVPGSLRHGKSAQAWQ